MKVGRETTNTEVMGEEFGEMKRDYAQQVRDRGNDNLAKIIEGWTPSKITNNSYIEAQKDVFPEFSDLLDDLKDKVKTLQEQGDEPFDHTKYFKETQNGSKFVANWLAQDIEKKYEFRHLEDSSQLFVFQEGYFQDRGRELIREECNQRLEDEISRRRIKEVTGIIEDRAYTERHNFRPPKRKINFENGVYDLVDEELVEHDPNYNFSYKIPVEYPEKPPDCDEIDRFLDSIVETEEEVKTLKEIAGYLMLPDYPINKAFILVGQGSNGKSGTVNLAENRRKAA